MVMTIFQFLQFSGSPWPGWPSSRLTELSQIDPPRPPSPESGRGFRCQSKCYKGRSPVAELVLPPQAYFTSERRTRVSARHLVAEFPFLP